MLLPLTSATSGRGAEAAERQMSLADCITEALEHNFDVQIERYNPILAESALSLVYGDYDPTISMRARHDYAQQPEGLDEFTRVIPGTSSDTDSLFGSISGLLPSGTTYNISSGAQNTYGKRYGLVGTNSLTFPFESSSANMTIGELRQPLLRNFWIDGTRLNLRLRKKDLQIADLNLRMRLINTINSVEQAYYDLVAARENVASAEIALQLATKLFKENQKRVEVGAMAQLDERQAQAQMAASEAAVIEARRSVDFSANVLKALLTDQYEKWHDVTIVPAEKLEALPADLDVQQAWNLAFQLRPDLLALIVTLEQRDLITRFQRNQLFPQLDAFGSIGWIGNGAGLEFSDVFSQVSEGSAPQHSYGASLSFPLSNRRARENYRTSKDQKAQAELRLRQTRQNIMIAVSDGIQQASSSFERVRATGEARRFAEEALAAEEKKLANGKSTSFEVLRLQRDLTQARLDETRARVDYNKAQVTLRMRQGTSLLKFDLGTPPPAMSMTPTPVSNKPAK